VNQEEEDQRSSSKDSLPAVARRRPDHLLEGAGNPNFAALGLEGTEVRFGIANSSLWAVATTAASNGSVNAMHDSFTPLGGMVPC
jgi:K+-transporting ATPase A subunit